MDDITFRISSDDGPSTDVAIDFDFHDMTASETQQVVDLTGVAAMRQTDAIPLVVVAGCMFIKVARQIDTDGMLETFRDVIGPMLQHGDTSHLILPEGVA